MYLQSWQIFLLGAIFGVFIAVLAGVLIIFALAKRYGVNKVELRNAGGIRRRNQCSRFSI